MKEQRAPTLFHDLGIVARLYGTVFWMIGQRLQRGPRWEEKLTEEALRIHALPSSRHGTPRSMRRDN